MLHVHSLDDVLIFSC